MEDIIAVVTLTALETILGIDNIIFISVLSKRLPPEQQKAGRKWALGGALLTRLLLLFSLKWIIGLKEPLLAFLDFSFSARDLILLFGGLFLLFKATVEIYRFVELKDHGHSELKGSRESFFAFLTQIALVDIVFSFDSVITAVGLVDKIHLMVIAVLISIGIMLVFAEKINEFIDENPTIKILAFSFLIVVGVLLVAEGFGEHIPKGYIYFSMFFTLSVEFLNMRRKRNRIIIKE
jgi:predicted tellurium resistance membrane protein TerC